MPELAHHIATFDAAHRPAFAPSLVRLRVRGVIRYLKMLSNHPDRCCTVCTYRDHFRYNASTFIEILASCPCCRNHVHGRPKRIEDSLRRIPSAHVCPTCPCECRRYARMLRRMHVFNYTMRTCQRNIEN